MSASGTANYVLLTRKEPRTDKNKKNQAACNARLTRHCLLLEIVRVAPGDPPMTPRRRDDRRCRRDFDKRHGFGIIWDSPSRCRVAPITGGGA